MYTCVICHFQVELDDVVVSSRADRCICLACYARTTGTEMAMPKELRRDIIAALAQCAAA